MYAGVIVNDIIWHSPTVYLYVHHVYTYMYIPTLEHTAHYSEHYHMLAIVLGSIRITA